MTVTKVAGFSQERWRILGPRFDQALEMTAGDRRVWMAALQAEDPTLAADLGALLAEAEVVEREGYLEGGAPAPQAKPSLAGATVGAYTLLSLVGRGGMGSVWLARRSDGRFEGEAAVKLLNASLVGDAGEARFRLEGNILARLRHPHIAHLIDAGVSTLGQPYLVLEHVAGERIDGYCDRNTLGIEARLRLFLDVLAAVAHAHANLVVHRDIKPSNVLVRTDGTVKLLDFGIAKLLDVEALPAAAMGLTREGAAVLTPEYAAPEQVTASPVTTATDVYSLGVLLYVLLCGRHPTNEGARSTPEVLRAVAETQPRPMSQWFAAGNDADAPGERPACRGASAARLRALLRGDLDTIAAKALKKDPQERYPSVTALADDLRRYLGHRPITARPDTLAYRARRFVRRNRVPAALGALLLAALLAGLAGTIWQARRAAAQAREAALQRDLALEQLVRAENINEFTAFLLGQAAPHDKAITMRELLQRAERMVDRRFTQDETLGVELLVTIGYVYTVLEEVDNAKRTVKRAYDASRQLADPAVRAAANCGWARVVAREGDFVKARWLIDTALAPLGDEARFDKVAANCLLDRAYIGSLEGDASRTVDAADAALDRLSRTAGAYSGTRSAAWETLAMGYTMRGETDKADRAFAAAMKELEQLGREDSDTAAVTLNNWAYNRMFTDTMSARQLQWRVMQIMGGESAPGLPAAVLANYGRLLTRLARYAEARTMFERARLSAQSHQNVRSVGTSSLGLARACRGLGDLGCAQGALATADKALRAAVPEGSGFLADLAHEQAVLAAARGDLESAHRMVTQALERHARVAEKRVAHIEALLDTVELELRMNRLAEAEQHARAALELAETLRGGAERSSWVGLGLLGRGEVQRAQRDVAAARQSFAAALVHLPATLGEEHPATQAARSRLASLR